MFELAFASLSKRVFLRSHSYENVFCLQVDFQVNQTYFHMKDFARRLGLKERKGNSEILHSRKTDYKIYIAHS